MLKLVDVSNKKPLNYILRFWEKEFKQIKPFIFSGNRRYYDQNTINLLMKIKFLLKNKGMTIKGAKMHLKEQNSIVDEINNKTINTDVIKTKLNKISNLLKSIKK